VSLAKPYRKQMESDLGIEL